MKKLLGSIAFLLYSLLSTAQASEIWLQPTQYLGPRNNNPYLQGYFGTVFETKGPNAYLSLHYESELIGTRHDFTLDLDRAYLRSGEFFFGRTHVWDLTNFRDRNDRWGMLAQFQPLNMGIQLDPMIIAPLGVHYLHSINKDEKIAFSASPLAVPNLGSEVSLNESYVSTNRFGRLPPGTVDINGVALPIRYQINAGNIFTDVLLKANLAGIYMNRVNANYTFAIGASYAPDPNPTSEVTNSYVHAATDDVTAVAVVHPTFPYRAQGYMSHTYTFPDSLVSIEGNYLFRDDPVQALEAVARYSNLFYLAYSQSFPSTLYLDHLLRAGIHLNLPEGFSVQSDIKTQLTQLESIWISGAVHFKPIGTKVELYLACDLFSGDEGTYFGEWRTNDRAYGGIIVTF